MTTTAKKGKKPAGGAKVAKPPKKSSTPSKGRKARQARSVKEPAIPNRADRESGAESLGQSDFSVEKIFLFKQEYRCVTFADPDEAPADRDFAVSWDWRFRDPGRVEVKVDLMLGPSAEAREEIELTVVGAFSIIVEDLKKDQLLGFVGVSAPSILFPYLREALTSLTARGRFGPVVIPPMNILKLASSFDPEKTRGWMQLEEDETLLTLARLG